MAGFEGFLILWILAPTGLGEDIWMAKPIKGVMAEKTLDIGEEQILIRSARGRDF